MEMSPDDPQPADEVDTQMQYSSDYLCSPSIGAVTKNHLQELRSAYAPRENPAPGVPCLLD
jgi:hypothetical protein